MNYIEDFQYYLRYSKNLEDSTVRHYSTELNGRIGDYATKYYSGFYDIFCMDINSALELIDSLLHDEDLAKKTKSSHGVQLTALKHYRNFLNSM